MDLRTAADHGIERFVEKMINFTDQLRRLRVDYYEYVSMKVIVLLTSGTVTNSIHKHKLAIKCPLKSLPLQLQ